MKSESFHVIMINYIDTKVEQLFIVSFLAGYQLTDIQLQFLQYRLVHDTVAVYQMLE